MRPSLGPGEVTIFCLVRFPQWHIGGVTFTDGPPTKGPPWVVGGVTVPKEGGWKTCPLERVAERGDWIVKELLWSRALFSVLLGAAVDLKEEG